MKPAREQGVIRGEVGGEGEEVGAPQQGMATLGAAAHPPTPHPRRLVSAAHTAKSPLASWKPCAMLGTSGFPRTMVQPAVGV